MSMLLHVLKQKLFLKTVEILCLRHICIYPLVNVYITMENHYF